MSAPVAPWHEALVTNTAVDTMKATKGRRARGQARGKCASRSSMAPTTGMAFGSSNASGGNNSSNIRDCGSHCSSGLQHVLLQQMVLVPPAGMAAFCMIDYSPKVTAVVIIVFWHVCLLLIWCQTGRPLLDACSHLGFCVVAAGGGGGGGSCCCSSGSCKAAAAPFAPYTLWCPTLLG